jgi:lipid-A-disaccharide synthase-like uncharacterized protein
MNCKYDGCQGKAVGWGYCQKHYRRYMKYGNAEPKKYDQEPMEVRFWKFVSVGTGLEILWQMAMADSVSVKRHKALMAHIG